jgi:hypothetical protein
MTNRAPGEYPRRRGVASVAPRVVAQQSAATGQKRVPPRGVNERATVGLAGSRAGDYGTRPVHSDDATWALTWSGLIVYPAYPVGATGATLSSEMASTG